MTTLLEVRDLTKDFPIRRGFFRRSVGAIHAVSGVSFTVAKGETLGLVGESGSGKSTTGRTVLRLDTPTSGVVRFDGEDLGTLDPEGLRRIRRRMQMIFQDPYASLNPRHTVERIVAEPLEIHGLAPAGERAVRVRALLERVGLAPRHARRYPHEFSGGQRQRIGIARALASEPHFIVADEPISALDVSIQAQIVNLLVELKEELGLTYLFIAHDLAMVRHLCDRVAVMLLGKIVESGSTSALFSVPRHPYTRSLLEAVPTADPSRRISTLAPVEEEIPDPSRPPRGCRFQTRCPFATEICRREEPPLRRVGGLSDSSPEPDLVRTPASHVVACHHADAL